MRYFLPALLCYASALAGEADWPTWRHDAQRSGTTAHALPSDMKLMWSRDLGKPDPAFDYHFRLCADQANEPVAAGGVVFLPSNTTDSVAAYDLATGGEKWCFITEGPVRFAPVVGDGVVFFGSDDGYLYCVDAASGSLKWKTRGAPEDRADYRMLVNERMCSRWPVRGGPVLDEGVLYFGCGIWPSEGVFLVALDAKTGAVKWRNADIAQIDDGLEEHGKMADMGLPPHGYLAKIAGRMAMPSGRALAAFANPQTGALDPYNSYYAKVYPVPRGSWALCSNADFWFQGGAIMGTSKAALDKLPVGPMSVEDFAKLADKPLAWAEDMIRRKFVKVREKDGKRVVLFDPRSPQVTMNIKEKDVSTTQLFQLAERPVLNMAALGTRMEVGERGMPVFTDKTMFRSEFRDVKGIEVDRGMTRVAVPKYDVIRAYNLVEGSWKIDVMPSKKTASIQRHLDFPVAWEQKVEGLTVKILAGDRLYLAGANKIVAIDTTKPSIVWQQKVQGYPVGVIAANGRLIVTSDAGKLYVFGDAAPVAIAASKPVDWERVHQWRAQVAKLKGNLTGGNALVLGWNSGELAKELAVQTTVRVIVAEPDASIAAKARTDLISAGPWAKRIHILSGTSEAMKLPPYFAEIVLSESMQSLDNGARLWTRIALDSLRPYTGVAVLPLRPKLIEQAKEHVAKDGGYEFTTDKSLTTIRRIAPPKGADDWTHEMANAGNTFASHDSLAVPPFGLLWYSGTIDREFSPAFEFHHNRNPYPTIAAGRMFMLAGNEVHAADAYTGRHLWKAAMPESAKGDRRLADHRQFSRATDQNIIAREDCVYVFTETEAHVLDPATGKETRVIQVPADMRGEKGDAPWDEVRVLGDLIYIAVANNLVALDRLTGALKWKYRSEQEHVAFTLGGDHAFVIGYDTARAQAREAQGKFESKLITLNATTGEKIWVEPLNSPDRPEQDETSAGKPKWSGVFMDSPLKPVLIYNAAHDVALAIVDRHRYFAFNGQSGSPQWQLKSGSRLSDLVMFEPPTVTSDLVICDNGTLINVQTGESANKGEVGGRGTGCNRFVGSDALITFRSALACFLDLDTKQRTYLSSTRPGCTNSMIPAAGLLNAPNFAHGCVCNYPFLTSFAMFHLPEAAKWAPKTKPDVQTQANPNAN